MNRISAVSVSEASVVSPYRPPRSEPLPVRNNWTNSDYPLAPQRVRYAASAPVRPVTQPQPTEPQTAPAPAAEPTPKPSIKQRLVLLAGALMVSVGTIAGFVSIVAVGPAGIGIAAAAAILGAALIRSGSKMQ